MSGAVTGTSKTDLAGSPASGTQQDTLVTAARMASREMRLRARLAPGIDEARWMILLDIYLAMDEGRETPFMSAAHASNVAVSTAQRYVHEMITDGLIVQHKSGADQRVSHVALSATGIALVTQILEAVIALQARHV